MPIGALGDSVINCYALVAFLIGVVAPSQRSAFIICLAVGLLVCVGIFLLNVSIELAGFGHVIAISGFASIIRLVKELLQGRKK